MSPARSTRTGVKAAVVSAGAVLLLSSGVAFAATGHAPWNVIGAAGGGRTTSSDGATDSGTPSSGPHAQAFHGLCRAYLSGNKAVHGHALQSPAFTALVTAAGGADNVAAFCAPIVAAPSDHPTQPTHPAATEPSAPTQPTHPTHPTHPAHPRTPRIRRTRRIRRTPRTRSTPLTGPTAPTGSPAHPRPHPTHPTHPAHD